MSQLYSQEDKMAITTINISAPFNFIVFVSIRIMFDFKSESCLKW